MTNVLPGLALHSTPNGRAVPLRRKRGAESIHSAHCLSMGA